MFLRQLPAVHGSFHFNETARNSLHRRKMPETNAQRSPRLGPYKDIFIVPQLHSGNRSRGQTFVRQTFPTVQTRYVFNIDLFVLIFLFFFI